MDNIDTYEQPAIIYVLDKPYIVKFTMRAVLTLEMLYGSIYNAFDKLGSSDKESVVKAVIDFLYALLAVEKPIIAEHLTADKIIFALEKISEALTLHFPDSEIGESKPAREPWDWDFLYYAARYHLKMSDSEFMNCTPRRFSKLNYMWRVWNGFEKTSPRKVFIDEISF